MKEGPTMSLRFSRISSLSLTSFVSLASLASLASLVGVGCEIPIGSPDNPSNPNNPNVDAGLDPEHCGSFDKIYRCSEGQECRAYYHEILGTTVQLCVWKEQANPCDSSIKGYCGADGSNFCIFEPPDHISCEIREPPCNYCGDIPCDGACQPFETCQCECYSDAHCVLQNPCNENHGGCNRQSACIAYLTDFQTDSATEPTTNPIIDPATNTARVQTACFQGETIRAPTARDVPDVQDVNMSEPWGDTSVSLAASEDTIVSTQLLQVNTNPANLLQLAIFIRQRVADGVNGANGVNGAEVPTAEPTINSNQTDYSGEDAWPIVARIHTPISDRYEQNPPVDTISHAHRLYPHTVNSVAFLDQPHIRMIAVGVPFADIPADGPLTADFSPRTDPSRPLLDNAGAVYLYTETQIDTDTGATDTDAGTGTDAGVGTDTSRKIWTLTGIVTAWNPDAHDYFGSSVALTEDPQTGDILLAVGAVGESSAILHTLQGEALQAALDDPQHDLYRNTQDGAGAVYIYRIYHAPSAVVQSEVPLEVQPELVQPEAFLKVPSSEADPVANRVGDMLGYSLSIHAYAHSEDTQIPQISVLVGAPDGVASRDLLIDDHTGSAGRAYLWQYRAHERVWQNPLQIRGPESTETSSDTSSNMFGYSVALDEQALAIGAPFAEDGFGIVDVYPLDAAHNPLDPPTRLTLRDPAGLHGPASPRVEAQQLGTHIALQGTRLAVSATATSEAYQSYDFEWVRYTELDNIEDYSRTRALPLHPVQGVVYLYDAYTTEPVDIQTERLHAPLSIPMQWRHSFTLHSSALVSGETAFGHAFALGGTHRGGYQSAVFSNSRSPSVDPSTIHAETGFCVVAPTNAALSRDPQGNPNPRRNARALYIYQDILPTPPAPSTP